VDISAEKAKKKAEEEAKADDEAFKKAINTMEEEATDK
jgi:hypothetical protein